MKKTLYAINDYDYGMSDVLYDNFEKARKELLDIYIERMLKYDLNSDHPEERVAEHIHNLMCGNNPYIEDTAEIHSFVYDDGKIG